MIKIEFDSIIYSLQRFGGVSVYWKNIIERVRLNRLFCVTELRPKRSLRCVPVYSGADILHSSHFRTTMLSSAKSVTTVHDLTYELGMLGWGLKTKLNIFERRRSYFNADAIICISENTKKDLLNVYPLLAGHCPIHVIHHGFSKTDVIEQQLPDCVGESDYVLYVGGRMNYKNFDLAFLGFVESGIWRYGYKLVCTGRDFVEEELEIFKKMGVQHALVNVGLVDEVTLFSLYKKAHCLLYTSRYEGFGLPLIEAMSVGCPVIGVNASCVPEIVGSAGILVDDDSPSQVAQAILNLVNHFNRNLLVESGLARASQFSWDISAVKHMEVYTSTASSNY